MTKKTSLKKILNSLFTKVGLIIIAINVLVAILYFIGGNIYTISNSSKSSEGCQNCHAEMEGFSQWHNPKIIGCASCHLGNSISNNKDLAHAGMIKIPGNLETANVTCGATGCHPGIKERVEKSMMNSMSGVVAVDRFVFNEETDLNKLANIKYLGNSAADTHLKNLCASCHIGNNKTEYEPTKELSRGGGCNACHLNYSKEAVNNLPLLKNSHGEIPIVKTHPALNINVTNNHCFGCHSRSGRISTNYEGWHETSLLIADIDTNNLQRPFESTGKATESIGEKKDYRLLEDKRIFRFVAEDIHHARGLDCIDCHNSFELMGDGKEYAHQNEPVNIRCEDCHSKSSPKFVTYNQLDYESKKIVDLRDNNLREHKYLVTKKKSIPLINTYINYKKEKVLFGKNSNRKYKLNPPSFICEEGKAHDRLSCNSCHTAWTPQCVGCHTEFDKNAKGYNNLTKTKTDGAWRELLGEFFAEPPTLGIMNDGTEEKRIETFVPGMIMTLDKSSFTGNNEPNNFHRLFAPTIAHTISAKGRSCKSCHNNPLAIGYGRGKLTFNKNGRWTFENEFALDEHDNLPQDAWIGFLSNSKGKATRVGSRPFTIDEQKKILTVGACLTCHEDNSKIMIKSLSDFDGLLKQVSDKCVLPNWN